MLKYLAKKVAIIALISLFMVLLVALCCRTVLADAAVSPLNIHVTVNAGQSIATVPSTMLGLGLEVWDDHMNDAAVPQLIKNAGIGVLRYPGGSYADIFHWKTSSAGSSGYVNPNDGFDNFMKIAKAAGTQVLITTNYGSNADFTGGGDPAEAAAWVDYANNVKDDNVRYWEIGNEVYGNGFYNGSAWEEDLHAPVHPVPPGKGSWTPDPTRLHNPLLGPTAYGDNVNAYVAAMKAKDPGIHVGAVLAVGGWPDKTYIDWNSHVLAECGQNIDFVVIHTYGSGKTASELFANEEENFPAIAKEARALVDQYCGAHAKDVEIWFTEGDASGFGCLPPGALYAAELFPLCVENGFSSFCWWDLHNGIGLNPDGKTYDDSGILSNATSTKGVSEPPLDTPFPPYYGVEMAHLIAGAGDRFVAASCDDDADLWTHATVNSDGSVGVMLINKDAARTAEIILDVKGASVSGTAVRYDYLPGTAKIVKSRMNLHGSTITLSVPAYAITDLVIPQSTTVAKAP